MATRVMRWPAIALLGILAAALIVVVVLEAPAWAWVIWAIVAVLMGPRSFKAALSGYAVDDDGIPMEKIAREGVVGETARWAALAYESAKRAPEPARTTKDFIEAALVYRYAVEAELNPGGSAEGTIEALMLLNENGRIHGFGPSRLSDSRCRRWQSPRRPARKNPLDQGHRGGACGQGCLDDSRHGRAQLDVGKRPEGARRPVLAGGVGSSSLTSTAGVKWRSYCTNAVLWRDR